MRLSAHKVAGDSRRSSIHSVFRRHSTHRVTYTELYQSMSLREAVGPVRSLVTYQMIGTNHTHIAINSRLSGIPKRR